MVSTWHEAQHARVAEGERRLASLPGQTQRLVRGDLRSLLRIVDAISVDTGGHALPAGQVVAREIDQLVAEIVMIADALDR